MRKLYFLISLLLVCLALPAQDNSIVFNVSDIYKDGFRGVKSIMSSDGTVVGHYLFYRTGESLKIDFLNTDLETIASSQIPYEMNLEIKDVVFNGKDLLCTVINRNGIYNVVEPVYFASNKLYTFSLEGKHIASKTIGCYVVDHVDLAVYPDELNGNFYLVIPTSSNTFKVQKVTSDFTVLWERTFAKEGHYLVQCETAFPGMEQLVLVTKKKLKAASKKIFPELIGLNGETGDIQFVTPLFDGKYTALPSQVLVDDEENIVAVGDYFKGNKEKSIKSKGVVIRKVSPTGEDLFYNMQEWKGGIQKQLKKTNMSVGFKNKVLFHTIVPSGNGGYQIVGETFSTSQAGGILGHMDKGGGAVAEAISGDETIGMIVDMIATAQRLKVFTTALISGRFVGYAHPDFSPGFLHVQDLVVFSVDAELNLTDVNKIPKPDYTKIYTYYPYNWYGGLRKAQVVADYGFFDYSFTQQSSTDGQAILVYNSSYSRNPHLGAVRIEQGVPSEAREIYFKELSGKKNAGKKGQAGCVPSVPGKMLVYYFDETGKVKDEDTNRKQLIGDVYFYLENVE